jgi:ABC-2 type transport system permease protein
MSSAPIADLSYRNYDGALDSPNKLWWVIARQVFRANLKKKSLWFMTLLAGGYYIVMMAIFFFTERMAQSTAPMMAGANAPPINPLQQLMDRIVWKDQFVHGISMGQMWFLIMTLVVGVGTIANDNRANALLVYLSKPCNKKDYLLGKWMGVFLTLLIGMSIPSIFFYAYGLLSYRDYGFFTGDKLLFFKLLFLLIVNAAFYASLAIGISSLFNQGRLAGATMAAVYFLSNFFTQAMSGAWIAFQDDNNAVAKGIVSKLFYGSVDGLNIGLAKSTFATSGSPPFGIPDRMEMVPAPPFLAVMAIIIVVSFLSMLIAWKRVRAVEVVG